MMMRQRTGAFLHRHKSAAFIVVLLLVSLALVGTARAANPLDTSFGNGGKVFTDFIGRRDVAYDMVIQPDGKIVVVGVTSFATGVVTTNFGLARYNSDGTLDTTFGTGGKVSTDFSGNYDTAYSVALQADGKIVVVGSTVAVYGSSQVDFAVARYNSDGTLDAAFGSAGKVIVDFATLEDEARAVVIQADNKIVIAGTCRFNNGSSSGLDFALTRLNSDGSLDTSFDGDGKLRTDIGGQFTSTEDNVTTLALYPDGKIVAGGAVNGNNFALVRYNPNGSLDTTFDTDGKVITDFLGDNNQDEIRSMVIQPDGKIVAVGTTTINYTNTRGFALARYNSDGSLDTAFGGGDGKVFTPPAITSSETATDVALTAGGKIVVTGYTSLWTVTVTRYLSDGNLDPVFGNRGRIYSYLANNPPSAYAVAIQADGKILVAGEIIPVQILNSTDNDFAIVRYKANPTTRPTRSDFDGDGRADVAVFRPSTGVWYVLNSSNGAVRAQPFGTSGDIAVPGDYDSDGITEFAVFRPSSGNWYILHSSDNSFRAEAFGTTGDVPAPADYDGDAKTDLAVYRPSNGTWYILRSSDSVLQAQQFGTGNDRPVPGYYDDDEKVDIAVFRDSTAAWYVLQSSTNTVRAQAWGQSGDIPAAEDYSSDGKFDFAVFRPGTGYWHIRNNADGSVADIRWGGVGDKPVPADYTGDSVVDVAVFRPGTGYWYIYIAYLPPAGFGTSGDTPVPAAYLP